MAVSGHATENGTHVGEEWEDIEPSPGHTPQGPLAHLQWDRVSGKIRRKPGHEHLIVTHAPPEKPA